MVIPAAVWIGVAMINSATGQHKHWAMIHSAQGIGERAREERLEEGASWVGPRVKLRQGPARR
eukprot:10790935-Alexandrium_andersonii.AAC.1